jgi:hypothetical protein
MTGMKKPDARSVTGLFSSCLEVDRYEENSRAVSYFCRDNPGIGH